MSMAACYSQNAAAFTRSSPHLRVELMSQGTLPEQVPDRRDTPTPLRLPGGEGTPTSCLKVAPHTQYAFTPSFSPSLHPVSRDLTTKTDPHPPLADKGVPPPAQIEVPLRPPPGGLEYNDLPPHLRHMRGYPHPVSGTISPTESASRQPPFRMENEGVPPLWCPEVPPRPIKAGYPPGPLQGVGLAQTSSPHVCTQVGGVPPATITLIRVYPPHLHAHLLFFVWNSRRSAAISGQCQTGGIPPTRVDSGHPLPPLLRAQGIPPFYPPLCDHEGGLPPPPYPISGSYLFRKIPWILLIFFQNKCNFMGNSGE